MKNIILTLMFIIIIMLILFVGCSEGDKGIKIGMVTDSGTIDDKSFNQGTWEGIKRYENDNDAVTDYIKPDEEATTDYLKGIGDLVDSGYGIIITPGYKFEEAIYQAQEEHADTYFVLIDGTPIPEADAYDRVKVGDKTVSIFFTEHESGFLAGVASALESKTGNVGFIGGMEIPPVQKFGWGFVAGIAYANKEYNTDVTVTQYIYQGTFTETEAGKTIAGQMFNRDIDIIFCAAGGVGIGAINEAKERVTGREEVYVVGVDVDQYSDGIYEDDKSVILTSAMKRIDNAAYDYIKLYEEDNFPGGETITMDIKKEGVGLPRENPNLSSDTIKKVDETKSKMQEDEVKAPSDLDSLNSFLSEYNYQGDEGVNY